ncbi:unnamed protein product, partial [Ectocarpus sp. 4 AP-2014]
HLLLLGEDGEGKHILRRNAFFVVSVSPVSHPKSSRRKDVGMVSNELLEGSAVTKTLPVSLHCPSDQMPNCYQA